MTPEGRVKKKIDAMLEEFGCYVEKPVPSGFGKSGLDYSVSFRGLALYIEAKKNEDEEPTPRQKIRAVEMLLSGATVMIVGSDAGLVALRRWFTRRAGLLPDPRRRGWLSGLLELVPPKNLSSSPPKRYSPMKTSRR